MGRGPAIVETPPILPRVRKSWFRRAKAVLLAALILSGGGGLPVLDVALSHLRSTPAHGGGLHLENAAHSHIDFCSLGSSISYAEPRPVLQLGFSVTVVGFATVALRSTPPRSADPALLPQPRAPPAFSA
jgi:hypothetical protein